MRYFNRQNAVLWLIALTAMLFGPKLPSAQAQPESLADWQTKAQPPLPSDRRVSFGGLVAAFHTGQFENQGDDQLFANYYEKRIFPYITDPKKRGEREDVVTKLHNDFRALGRFPNSPVLDKLIDITLEYMAPIAKDGKWPPAVRENALLAIGEVKSPKAVPLLLEMIKNKELHPMFKVVAMADLVHLAEQGVLADEAVADPVVKLMAMAVPRKIPNDGWRWMRGQAADILGLVGNAGNNVPDALLTMLADEDLPLIIRGKAARAGQAEIQRQCAGCRGLFQSLRAVWQRRLGGWPARRVAANLDRRQRFSRRTGQSDEARRRAKDGPRHPRRDG